MRWVRTRVLPEPAPAITSSGPSVVEDGLALGADSGRRGTVSGVVDGHCVDASGGLRHPRAGGGHSRKRLRSRDAARPDDRGPGGRDLDGLVRARGACEEHGVETLFRSDHYISQGDETRQRRARRMDDDRALAARTTTLRLGTLVSPATFRRPDCSRTRPRRPTTSPAAESSSGSAPAGWSASTARTASRSPRRGRGSRCSRNRSRSSIDSGRRSASTSAAGTTRSRTRPRSRGPCSSRGRRCSSAAAADAAPPSPPLRFADEYNTPFVSPEVASAPSRRGMRRREPPLRFSVMTGCVIGETREDALERARTLYARRAARRRVRRLARALRATRRRRLGRGGRRALRAYERAGCERVMLQHLLHTDLEPVALIGRELAPALA